ncbi:hypothetical protein GCM10022416_43340 [Actinomadura keratinilytica]|uniref:Secreted protein n=1 Tax=Actinomadura keratinilytica TaxID=547461 RepID=A0ABP7Z764_9ACTN
MVFFSSRTRVVLGVLDVLVVAAERRRVVVAARLGLVVLRRCVVRLRVVLVSATVAMSAPGTVLAQTASRRTERRCSAPSSRVEVRVLGGYPQAVGQTSPPAAPLAALLTAFCLVCGLWPTAAGYGTGRCPASGIDAPGRGGGRQC